MKALTLENPYEVGIVDIARPHIIRQGEAIIRVVSAGICGSDIGAYRGTNQLVQYPRIIGHEIAGEIMEIASDYQWGLTVGDRVVLDPYIYCCRCYPCSIGRTNCCENLRVLGVHVDGGMTEYICHPTHLLHKAPAEIPWDILPMVEPLVIALHALHRAKVKAGEHLAVFGAGPIGLLECMAAQVYGAVPIVIDPVIARLEEAQKLGVRHVINPVTDDLKAKVMEFTAGRGAEVVLESSGANSAIIATLDIVSYAGRIVLTGWPQPSTALPTGMITKKEVTIYGSRTGAGEFPEAIELVRSGKVGVRRLLTQVIGIDDAPSAIADIEKNPANYLKVNVLLS